MRIRTIKPEFFWDVKIGRLSCYARLTFIGLWCLADDYGTLDKHPLVIKGQLFPFDPDVDIEACLRELEEQKLILRYGPEKLYIYIPGFKKHQKINRPSEYRQAPPPEEFGIDVEAWLNENSLNTHGGLSEDSLSTHGGLTEHSVTEYINSNNNKETETEIETDIETETDIVTETETETEKRENKKCTANAVLVDEPDDSSTIPPPTKKNKITPCPYQEIVELYHKILPDLPRCRLITETRKRYIKARWREILTKPELMEMMVKNEEGKTDREKGLLWFERFFKYVSESNFLCGKVPPGKDRDHPFMADLEWLMRPNNFVKVLEGRYHVKDEFWSKLSHAGRKTAMAAMNLLKRWEEEERQKEENDGVVQ